MSQWVSADYCLRQRVPDSWHRPTKGSSREVCPGERLVQYSGTADERSVRSLMRALMWRLRYVGAVPLLRLLKVNTATLYSMLCWMGSQCSSRSYGWSWDRLGAWRTILAALFCTRCRTWMLLAGAPSCSSPVWSVWDCKPVSPRVLWTVDGVYIWRMAWEW